MLPITFLLLSFLVYGAQAAPLKVGIARRSSVGAPQASNLRRFYRRQEEEDFGLGTEDEVDNENNIFSSVNGGAVSISAEQNAAGAANEVDVSDGEIEDLDIDSAVDPDATADVGDASAEVDASDPAADLGLGSIDGAAADDVVLAGATGEESLAGGSGNDLLQLASATSLTPRTTVNAATITLVKSFEGFEPSPADDGVGFPTVGFGHKCIQTGCAEVPFTIPLSRANADALLLTDMQEGIDCVNDNVQVDLNDNQFGALASFAFNAGCGSLRSSTLLRRLNAGEDPDTVAAAELPKFNKATDQRTKKKITLAGLTRRRAAEVALFQSP